MEIRNATIKDATTIALLGRITFTDTFGHLFRDKQDLLNYLNLTFSVDKIEKSIVKSNTIYWLSFVEKLPVGYAKLKLNSHSEFLDTEKACQLQKIYVLKDFLSQKIGFHLQCRLFEKAKEEGNEKIWLSVLESNQRAKSFYEKNGFEVIGNHDFRIGKESFDFIAMAKSLL